MPRLMKAIARFVVPVLAVGALAVACTGATHASTTPRTPTSTASPTSVGAGQNATGDYTYHNAGVTATLHLSGTTGTLEIVNKTDITLDPPGFYLLDARDGHRVDGTVDSPTPTASGATTTFQVSFSGLDVKNIGMAVLTVGDENFGAFAPR
jgi:hypothetical protein